VKTLLGIPRLEAERRGVAGGDEKKWQWSVGVGKGMKLTGGPHMAVTWEREGVSTGVRNVEENTPFGKYANAAWAERDAGGLRGGAGQCGGGAGLDGPKFEEISFLKK
jgi:hypothetical protein